MRRSTLHHWFAVAIVVVAAATLTGVAAAASDANITASPNAGTATATHNVTVTVGESGAGNLTNVTVDYGGTGADVTGVGPADVTVGLDRGDDAAGQTTDVDVTSNVTSIASGFDGTTLTIRLSGATAVAAGDEVVLSLDDVTNPPQGEYQVPVSVDGGSNATATLTVAEATPTASPTATPTPTATDAGGDGNGTATATDTGGQPGFGLAATLAALFAAALLGRR